MKFKDKFKKGDIICSDKFHGALCMVVEKYEPADIWDEKYHCQDLVKEYQGWLAYEFDSYSKRPYDWRIATDEDIANYLTIYLDIRLGKVGEFYVAKLTDEGIVLEDSMFTDRDLHFDVNELVDLKKVIDRRVAR